MISKVDENAPKCVSIHKKRIQILRPFFYSQWPYQAIIGPTMALFLHCQLLEEEKLFQMILKVDETSPTYVSIHSFYHKKGINSIDHSFMAISGHYLLKNSHF